MKDQHKVIDELITHRTKLPDGRIEERTIALCETPDRQEAFAGTMWCEEHGRVIVRHWESNASKRSH